MSKIMVVGSVLWIIMLFLSIITEFTYNGTPVKSPAVRVVILTLSLLLIGIIASIIGLIGLVILQPILHLLGWGWFIATTL